MSDIPYHKNKIISTLAYYGAFGRPLTPLELRERLVRTPHRIPLAEIMDHTDRLVQAGTVVTENGTYALAGTAAGFGACRIEQEKIWAQKWRRMLRRARWLQAVPYVRGLYASGSLALGNMSADSDWDFFTVARSGRLYTARLGLVLGAWVLGALRTKHDTTASDKFCFNHYVTTDGLAIRHRSLYTAHGLAMLVPVYDPRGYLERLWQANHWIGDFRPMPDPAPYVRRSVRRSRLLVLVQRTCELVLDTFIGDGVERLVRSWQQRRIARDPATHERGGRVVADDREMEFHPRSFEATALARYNAVLTRHGLGAYAERDSGLRR